jgi:hypothetical protein
LSFPKETVGWPKIVAGFFDRVKKGGEIEEKSRKNPSLEDLRESFLKKPIFERSEDAPGAREEEFGLVWRKGSERTWAISRY